MSLFSKPRPTRPQPNLEQLLSEFNHSLTLIVDKQLLISNFIAKVKQIGAVESVYIFLLDENTGKYKQQNPAGKQPFTLTSKDRLISWLSVNEKPLLLSRNRDIAAYLSAHEQEILTQLGTELIYPLKIMNHISGTILLGKKSNGVDYTDAEISLLSLLVSQATFAIEHASLYEIQTERLRKMYRTDRLATLGELAAGAAHEIRNPLTAIRSTIQYLSKDFADTTTLQADAEQLKQVFLNIILNAVEAMSHNEPSLSRTLIISIEKGAPIDPHTRYLLLSFEDSGKGINQQDIEKVFNPFFTTKEEGTGLGLAICYGIVNRHEGEIEVRSTPGKGTCFNVKLPQRI